MIKRKKVKNARPPFFHNEYIVVYYQLNHGRDVIKPGDKIQFKNTRGVFTFLKWVHNASKDVTWIDVIDPKTSEYKSFYMDRLKGVYRAKKSIRKKLV